MLLFVDDTFWSFDKIFLSADMFWCICIVFFPADNTLWSLGKVSVDVMFRPVELVTGTGNFSAGNVHITNTNSKGKRRHASCFPLTLWKAGLEDGLAPDKTKSDKQTIGKVNE